MRLGGSYGYVNTYIEMCEQNPNINKKTILKFMKIIRYEKKNGKKELPYLLNSSALAIGRTIVALMENYQTSDGKVDFNKIFSLLRP